MNGENRKQAKSSWGNPQKSPGDRLKNEESVRAAVRKKLRYGKKDNSLSIEARKELRKQVAQGRNRIYADATLNRKSSREIDKYNEDENVGTEAVARGMESSGLVAEKVKLEGYGKKLHKRTKKDSDKKEAGKKEAGIEASKTAQKNKLKRDMINEAQKEKAKGATVGRAGESAGDLLQRIGKSMVGNSKVWLIALVILLVILVCVMCCSSFLLLFGSVEPSTLATSFTASDSDILEVESDYDALESSLQGSVNSIRTDYPGYDEYRFNLAGIGHDPYQLASILTVLYEDYTPNEVQSRLQSINDAQYELTSREIVEIRTRTETRTRWEERSRVETRTDVREVWDEETQSYVEEEYTYEETVYYWVEVEYEVEVEYGYYILQTDLTNTSLDTVVRNMNLPADAMMRYELLLATRGNKPYLFGDDA